MAKGSRFLKQHESEWPITKTYSEQKILINTIKLELPKPAIQTNPEDTLASRINIEKYSNYRKLLRVTARILAMYKKEPKPTLTNATRTLIADDIDNAERFWILEAQTSMQKDIQSGKYKRLCPRKRDDGIYVVGGRARGWMEMSYNKSEIILLPYGHRFSRLYAGHIHSRGHLVKCKQNTKKVLDHQIAETDEIHQNKLCKMQEVGQEIKRTNHGKTPN